MVFEPVLVEVMPGDTVKFVPIDRRRNAESIEVELTPDWLRRRKTQRLDSGRANMAEF